MKTTKKIFLTSFFSLMLTTNTKAEMIETHDTKLLQAKLSELKAGDMALFDVSNILFYASDQVMRARHKSVYNERFEEIEKEVGQEKAHHLKSITLASYKPVLVDKMMPKIISDAQKASVLVFGLTSGKTSQYGVIESRADLRIKTLKDFGIDFSKSKRLDFIDLGDYEGVNANENGNSIYKEGIIFTSRIPKGEILGRFLKVTKLQPRKIVFVDNKLKNINSVAAKCDELGIEYLGIYFTKAANSPVVHLDKDVVDKKFEILLKDNKWVSDEEAKTLIKK